MRFGNKKSTQNQTRKRWKACPAVVLMVRLAALYVAWGLCRVVFYLQNRTEIGPISFGELPDLLHGSWVFDTVSILYINALFIILSLLPFRFREKRGYDKGLFWLYIVTNTVALMLNTADGIYYHFAKKRFTSDELNYLSQNDNTSNVVFRAMADNWYIVLFVVVLIAGLIWWHKRWSIAPSRIRSNFRYVLLHLPALLLAVGLSIGGIRGGFSRQTRPITLSNATLYTSSSLKANLILSNPFCLLRTLGNHAIVYTKFFSPEELDTIYSPYHRPQIEPQDSLRLGLRNIVIVVLESFSSEHSALLNPDLYPDGKGYTPFLDSLMREGYYFQNAFANGHKSIEALPSILSSIPSYRTPFISLPQSLAPMKALPTLLSEKGYATMFFNGSGRGSMGFGAYATQAGVETYYSREDYEARCGKGEFDGYWGIWDEPFLQYMSSVLSETPQPFFASVFTLSSHHPFVVPEKYKSVLPEGRTKIHPGVAYTDLAVRKFMERSSSEPWYRNTIFVFVADHVSSETFAPKTMTPTGRSQIICFLYTPDGALRGRETSLAQQIDLMPTLLGLIGHDTPYFAFGRDLFQSPTQEPMVVNFMNETFQGITDSLVLFSDGERLLSAFLRSDTLQQNNILPHPTPELERSERNLNARIQQYYQHVEKGDYLSRP